MKYIRNISDEQNKVGDTDNVFRLNLFEDTQLFNFGDNQLTVNVANSSGYILSLTPKKETGNTVIDLDFNDAPLKSLTPDDYLLEVEVKFSDGTTATFPTKGGMPFTVNSNLKSTTGQLVPTVTFDNVLAAVDEKIAVYMDTVKVGPVGPQGPAGNVDTSNNNTFTGANAFTQQIDGSLKTRNSTFTDFATVAADMIKYAGFWQVGSDIMNAPKPGMTSYLVEVIPSTTTTNGVIRAMDYVNMVYYNATVIASTLSSWKVVADDTKVIHNTGTETIAGDKTLTGSVTFTQAINGFLGQRTLTITDLNLLNSKTYNGIWGVDGSSVLNSPETNAGLLTNSVLNSGSTIQKFTLMTGPNKSRTFERVYSGTWSAWSLVPVDGQVVHNTGTETINGDKTFRSGNYGLRVTSTGIQKTSDNGVTWVNI
ncbi:pyocin knob domain-containing protein [Leuconostoc lactis]|uniref:pyocin knob domain-containing protein n=1 Tax=Leuconostoc lactis TaxID=1246 RepID=UPI0024AC8755|nr:pyocin knob domain-containing protein [Leuconostoc lactis]MDI6495510.1 pyocin knob domain-containing protein [Leuconostoc lactis]